MNTDDSRTIIRSVTVFHSFLSYFFYRRGFVSSLVCLSFFLCLFTDHRTMSTSTVVDVTLTSVSSLKRVATDIAYVMSILMPFLWTVFVLWHIRRDTVRSAPITVTISSPVPVYNVPPVDPEPAGAASIEEASGSVPKKKAVKKADS